MYIYIGIYIGSKFVIKSDHNPLTYIQKKKDPHGKITRWMAELECFDFTVEHISGKRNQKAEALSRNKDSAENSIPEDFGAIIRDRRS